MVKSGPEHMRLQQHIAGAYHNLRIGIALLGAALPVALWLREQIPGGAPLRGSMSVYYYSDVSRDIFIGALCAIGVFLYLYKGFSTKENVALNLAGLFAVIVALFPTTDPSVSEGPQITVHIVSAALFFMCIAYVAIFRASDTLSLIRDKDMAAAIQMKYRLVGIGMIISPLAALATSALLRPDSLVFFLEAIAVWMFAIYWLLKSNEIRRTNAEYLALAGKLQEDGAKERKGRHIGRLMQLEPSEQVAEWDDRLGTAQNRLVSNV